MGMPVTPTGPRLPASAPKACADLLGVCGPGLDGADGRHHLGFVQLVIAAEEEEMGPVVDHINQRLDLVSGRDLEEIGDFGDGLLARGVNLARGAGRGLVDDLR